MNYLLPSQKSKDLRLHILSNLYIYQKIAVEKWLDFLLNPY